MKKKEIKKEENEKDIQKDTHKKKGQRIKKGANFIRGFQLSYASYTFLILE